MGGQGIETVHETCATLPIDLRHRVMVDTSDMSTTHNQQPIQRTIGRRKERDGQPLTPADRDAVNKNTRYVTRSPKGIFIYYSAEEMDADRIRWTIDAMIEKARARGA